MQRSRPFRAASFLYAIICRELELSAESAVQGAMGILLDEGAAVVEDVLRHEVARLAVPLHRLCKRLRLFFVRLHPEFDDFRQHG